MNNIIKNNKILENIFNLIKTDKYECLQEHSDKILDLVRDVSDKCVFPSINFSKLFSKCTCDYSEYMIEKHLKNATLANTQYLQKIPPELEENIDWFVGGILYDAFDALSIIERYGKEGDFNTTHLLMALDIDDISDVVYKVKNLEWYELYLIYLQYHMDDNEFSLLCHDEFENVGYLKREAYAKKMYKQYRIIVDEYDGPISVIKQNI